MRKDRIVLIFLIIFFIIISGCVNSDGASAPISKTSSTPDQSCFKFSDDRVVTNEFSNYQGQLYAIEGNITNTCMKNYQDVTVQIKFYDKDNVLAKTNNERISNLQHGTTVKFSGYYMGSSGMNNATRYELGIGEYKLQ